VSEGRDRSVIAALEAACGRDLLDRHTDPWHHRSVFTVVGEAAVRRLAVATIELVDLGAHEGAHPRRGALDVVPFVAWGDDTMADALAARDRTAAWLGGLGVPCFLYGPERTLPEVRRHAFTTLQPDTGPGHPHPTAGAACVGARPPLVAYNVWLATDDLATARHVAGQVRSDAVRALGLQVGPRVQVSMNLVDPLVVGPAEAHDAVAARAEVAGAELVGLLPDAVLRPVPRRRWAELDLAEERTVESRLAARTQD
jgi:glutamate formiminotransferase